MLDKHDYFACPFLSYPFVGAQAVESTVELLAGFKVFTTSVDALVVVDIVLPAAINSNMFYQSFVWKRIIDNDVLLGLVGVGETVLYISQKRQREGERVNKQSYSNALIENG